MSNWVTDYCNTKSYRLYNNGVIGFRVFCGQADVLDSVHAYLGAHFKEELLDDAITWDIYAERHDLCLAEMREMSQRHSCLYTKREESGTLTIRDEKAHKCFLACDPESTDIFAFTQDIYCTIRRLSIRSFDYSVVLHAAACRLMDKTVLLLGEKGAGKSLLTDSLMLKHNADYIAADQTILRVENNELFCSGNITSYRVWETNNILCKQYMNYKCLFDYALNMADVKQRTIKSKLNLPPRIATEILKKRIAKKTKVDFLIFLGEQKEDALTEIAPSDAYRLLKKYILQDGYKDYEYGLDEQDDIERKQEFVIRRILSNCKFWKSGKNTLENVEYKMLSILELIGRRNNE